MRRRVRVIGTFFVFGVVGGCEQPQRRDEAFARSEQALVAEVAPGAEKRDVGGSCAVADDCKTGVCFNDGEQKRCLLTCTSNDDCPGELGCVEWANLGSGVRFCHPQRGKQAPDAIKKRRDREMEDGLPVVEGAAGEFDDAALDEARRARGGGR